MYGWRTGRWAFVIGALLVVILSPLAWAIQREIRSKCHSFPNAPIEVREPRVRLVEVYSTSTAMVEPFERVRGTRVRYLNRSQQLPSAFVLDIEVTCVNRSPQTVEAVKVTLVPMNAFHEPLKSSTQKEGGTKQVMVSLSPGSSRVVSWEQRAPSADVYQVAVVVTAALFADGSRWFAPDEELIESF